MEIINLENQHTAGVYAKRPLVIVRGEGALLWDEDGREYIDCSAGHGSANLGHAHPALIKAITAQAQKLMACPETFYNDRRAEYTARLAGVLPDGMERIFLCNSGTESIEAAIKFSRYSTQRTKIVAAMRGFHGRTMGALSATWNKKYREPFEPLVPDYHHVPYNNLDKMDAAITADTAAVILEVIQGEGGVYPGDAKYLESVQRICNERGTLLILDEVQTGFGRTGKLFAFQHYDLQPDILCLAKSIAGGVPMGAVALGERVSKLAPGIHASTFGGNPLACAAALTALDVIKEEKLSEKAAELGTYLINRLNKISSPLIREIRGMGLMVGIEIKQKIAPFLEALLAKGVITIPSGLTTIRLLPPLVITKDQLDSVVAALEEVFSA